VRFLKVFKVFWETWRKLQVMEARDEVAGAAGEVDELKARNEKLAAEVEVLRARVRALEARNEAQVRRANDAWRQIRAIVGHALRS
jgi:FtsZ-binding cell division protein ZapB